MARVLVIGATGYVGGWLLPRLLTAAHSVRCLVRDPRKVLGRKWRDRTEIAVGDVLQPDTLSGAFEGIEAVYYLVHSMAVGGERFEELDRRAASNVVTAAESAGVARIIYLGGLGRREEDQTPHLRSRHEVGDILRSSGIAVTEFRAAVIVGSGSLSFEMIHHLVNRLPVMICPRWVFTKTQPIAIADVLEYLVQSLNVPASVGGVFDIGGPDIMTYRDMMLATAEALGLKRALLQVPVLTPRLSSYWVNLVTPVPARTARSLIESLRSETICEHDTALKMFAIRPMSFARALELALARVRTGRIETTWTDATSLPEPADIDPSHLRADTRETDVLASAERVFAKISSIGGENGWYYADWLWRLRGFIDEQLGGVGLRRGRRHPSKTAPGEALDFWRVEEYLPQQRLLLRAEMNVWGHAWLGFDVQALGPDRSKLTMTARYYPRGLFGLLYWYLVYPLHALVFRGLIRAIARRAEIDPAGG